MSRTFSILIACLALAGCGGDEPGAVSRSSFEAEGKIWPLTVDRGTVGCTGITLHARWFQAPDGRKYSLGGTAPGSEREPGYEKGYPPIDPIWALDDEENARFAAESGVPVGADPVLLVHRRIGDLMDAARAFCGT